MRSLLFLGISPSLVLLAACGSTVVSQQTGGSSTSGTTHAVTTSAASTTGTGAGATTTTSTTGAGGSTTATTGTVGSSTSTSSGVGTGGGSTHGACQTSADCNGNPCAPITPGGYLVCLSPVAEATSCQVMGPPNQCCTAADCPSADSCYPAASLSFCGGAFPNYNVCAGDACTSDAACAKNEICAPAGAFGYPKRECLTAYCKTDADCTAKPGGACVPIGGNPCCSLQIPDGLGCAYPGDCAAGTPCPSGQQCRLDATTGTGACTPFQGCPP